MPANEIVHERYDVYWKVTLAGGERPRISIDPIGTLVNFVG